MGVKLKDIVVKEEISFSSLKGKIIAIDAYNVLYQFLSSIRQMDGTYLTNSKGQITSHLIGLFSRMTKLLQLGIKPVMIFDGKANDLKKGILEQRKAIKEKAKEKYERALKDGQYDEARKYARQISRLTPEMTQQAKKLLEALGIPFFTAPSEGEAEAAYLAKDKKVYAAASQDYDALLFGSPMLIQNLTLSSKRKNKGKLSYETISPQILYLKETLDSLEINHNQLILLGILTGTDFAPKGVPGLGPKKALKVVKELGDDVKKISEYVKWDEHNPDVSMDVIFNLFSNFEVNEDVEFEFKCPDKEKLICFLCDEFDFTRERVLSSYEKIMEVQKENTQKNLFEF